MVAAVPGLYDAGINVPKAVFALDLIGGEPTGQSNPNEFSEEQW
jgi:hypothetical protein